MIDLHCHIIPGIDDGSNSLYESLEMARIAAHDGIKAIVATPHVYQGTPSPEKIADNIKQLKEEIKKNGINIKIFPGAEIAFPAEIDDLKNYSINRTNNVLVEFPHNYLPISAANYISNVVSKGFAPIIAHPERNLAILRNPAKLFELIKKGAYVQLTSSSISGDFGKEIQALCVFLLKKKVVHLIASDSHGTGFRKPVLTNAIRYAEKFLDIEYINRLTYENPLRILEGRKAL